MHKGSIREKFIRSNWILAGVFLAVFSLVSYALFNRLGAFGCGDECINYAAGYFLNQGKSLYREIFFNHQPGLAYLSAVIQSLVKPAGLYSLVLSHRAIVMAFSLVSGVLLIIRFGVPALLFLILYEVTKYYFYGYQFIGEAFAVYPLVFLINLLWDGWLGRRTSRFDGLLLAAATATVFYVREPYVPVAFIMFAGVLWQYRRVRGFVAASLAGFGLLTAPMALLPLRPYYEQVVVSNLPAATGGAGALGATQLLRSMAYPLLLFVSGSWTFIRLIEIGLATVFWAGSILLLRKAPIAVVGTMVILGIAAVRVEPPGRMFYEAFHMLPWYGLFVGAAARILTVVQNRLARRVLTLGFLLVTAFAWVSPQSFLRERVDRMGEFETQYTKYTYYSEAIRAVSGPSHTLFLDMWDDVIYWEAKRPSAYPLSLYIPVASLFPEYRKLRADMFLHAPPDLYYSCPALAGPLNSLPEDRKGEYVQLFSGGKPGCLYLKKSLVTQLSDAQKGWLTAHDFSLPGEPPVIQ